MPIEIVKKQKSTPKPAGRDSHLVPLRVVEVRSRCSDSQASSEADVGDILFSMPSNRGGYQVVNATKGVCCSGQNMDLVLCVRAYDVQSIVLTNDDSPAPVL